MNKERTISGLPMEVEDRLIQMWSENVSTKQIGLQLGITKNAVVGRVRRLAERGLVQQRANPIPLRRGPDGVLVPVVSRETAAQPVMSEEDIERERQETVTAKRRAAREIRELEARMAAMAPPPSTKDEPPIIPPLPPEVHHTRAVLREMHARKAVDLPLTALRPDGTQFFFFGPSQSPEPYIPLPDRRGCPWIVGEPVDPKAKRPWQGAATCGKRVAAGVYCLQHHAMSSGTAIRRGFIQ